MRWVAKPISNDRKQRWQVFDMSSPQAAKEHVAGKIRSAETARLIASAPQLVAALRRIIDHETEHSSTTAKIMAEIARTSLTDAGLSA